MSFCSRWRSDNAVPVDAGGDVALAQAVDGAIVERQPFRLGLDQLVAHLLQHRLVVGAVLAAFVGDGEEHDVTHFGHDIDLADQFGRRIEEDAEVLMSPE